jgi:hypothetical protein
MEATNATKCDATLRVTVKTVSKALPVRGQRSFKGS